MYQLGARAHGMELAYPVNIRSGKPEFVSLSQRLRFKITTHSLGNQLGKFSHSQQANYQASCKIKTQTQ